MSDLFKYGFAAFLIILLGFNVYRAYEKDWNYADPVDLRGLYIGTEQFHEGQEIYNNKLARERWLQHKEQEQFESNSDMGDMWISVMLYPPQTFVQFYPLHILGWKQVRLVWWVICAACLLAILWLLYSLTGSTTIVVLALAAKAGFFAISLGQPLLWVFACILLAFKFEKHRPLLAGLFFGLAMIKFNLMIPIGIFFLLRRRWKLIGAAALTTLLLLLPIVATYPEIIEDYFLTVSGYYNLIYTQHPENPYTFSNSELTNLLDQFVEQETGYWNLINLLSQVLAYLMCSALYLRQKIDQTVLLMALILCSFLFSYHLSYDALLFLLPIALMKGTTQRLWMWWFALLALPWNAVFSDILLIKLNYPLFILAGLALLIFASSNRNEQVGLHPNT